MSERKIVGIQNSVNITSFDSFIAYAMPRLATDLAEVGHHTATLYVHELCDLIAPKLTITEL